jgi:hypothetical protein
MRALDLLGVTRAGRPLKFRRAAHPSIAARSQVTMAGLLARDGRGGGGQETGFLWLRIFADDGRVIHQRVLPGMTIGSAESCTLRVGGEGVLPVHAEIEQQGLELAVRARDGAALVLGDGTWMEHLRLCHGVRFRVGAADVHCSNWASASPAPGAALEPAGASAPAAAGDEPARSSELVKVLCDRCGAELGKLPASARFCPRCGRARDGFAASAAPVGGPEMQRLAQQSGPVDWRAALGLERSAEFIARQPASAPTSAVLQGYASAMHSLGEKYEAGRGAVRNEREAVRCYFKAAKLGSEEAHERLAERGIVPRPAK